MSGSERRRELADFLRSRRERLKPADLCLPHVARRRTPGLRREEIAEIAGVGATWYTWLEQARDIQPSEHVLSRLAVAFNLTSAETDHLFGLAGRVYPRARTQQGDPEIPASVLRLIDIFVAGPAIVLGRAWDILAYNTQAQKRFRGLAELPPNKQNWLYLIFCSPATRNRVVDWESIARRILAEFRLSVSDGLDDPQIGSLIESLKKESSEFKSWWDQHDVREQGTAAFALRGQDGGTPVSFERLTVIPSEAPALRVLFYMPLEIALK